MLISSSSHSALHRLDLHVAIPDTPRPALPLPRSKVWMCQGLDKPIIFRGDSSECSAISKPRTQSELCGIPVIKWNEVEDEEEEVHDDETNRDPTSNGITEQIALVKSILSSMEDGEINASAYDTAWVALVEDVNASGVPQFPSALEWISKNQHPDGSWGDWTLFSAHDRIINTLACVIALKTWNIQPEKVQRGLKFIERNMGKLEDEKDEHMPIAFEVAFPNLLELAKEVDIEVPDSPFLQKIYAKRGLKLTRIPKDILHIIPTTLLYSLEGLGGLDWEKLLKLRCNDGSFLFSPSSTAFALMQTKDEKCLNYLQKVVQRFEGGVPNVYPVDLFEHIWAVDRLQRLGIVRYFQAEINECLQYVHRYWTEKGICWARKTRVEDIDDTAMGFRLLRLHGFDVSADVFGNFKKGEEFVCFAGQSTSAVTGMYNLFRASQLQFPGEKILDEIRNQSSQFLRQKQACGELFDKWIIMKDLPGEVGYALDVPWYASLPRLESRIYIEQYGGEDDVWIGKTLYRMPFVNNNTYLELAKSDYNNCQAFHQLEWDSLEKWYAKCSIFGELGVGRRNLLLSYYLAAASIFEPEHSTERLAWAKSAVLMEAIVCYFQSNGSSIAEQKKSSFINEFRNKRSLNLAQITRRSSLETNKVEQELVFTLLKFLNHLSLGSQLASGKDEFSHFCQAWEKWVKTIDIQRDDGYKFGEEADLLVQTINISANRSAEILSNVLSHPTYNRLSSVTNKLCRQLRNVQSYKVSGNGTLKLANAERMLSQDKDSDMQELVQSVLQNSDSDDLDKDIKRTFFTVARTFYYVAHCDPVTVNDHIARVLFERVE